MKGIKPQRLAPANNVSPSVEKSEEYDFFLSYHIPHIGGPINCKIPLTNKLIPYDEVNRSVPNKSAIITAVIPTYVPDAKPNNPHHKDTIE